MAKLYHGTKLADLNELMGLSRFLMGLSDEKPVVRDWDETIELSRIWHIAGKLWHSGNALGRLPDLPASVAEALHLEYCKNQARNQRLKAKLFELIRLLSDEGLTPVLMKGSVYLVDPPSGDNATRYMHDLDFMIRELHQLDRANQILIDHGLDFVQTKKSRTRPEFFYYHFPTLIDPEQGIEIELHKQPLRAVKDPLLDLMNASMDIHQIEGCDVAIPNRTFRLLHNVIHAQEAGKSLYHAYFNPRYLVEGYEYLDAMSDEEINCLNRLDVGYRTYIGSWFVLLEKFLDPETGAKYPARMIDRLQYQRIMRRGGFPEYTTLMGTLVWQLNLFFSSNINPTIRHALLNQE